ncbi:glutathione S-transferase protein [Stappia sp. 22II-S9-Z10]|nr:glutathione S-transferase protein [Stappia sp. 22II-S9-Z10]
MADLVFYTNPMSRGRIARWMLEETGAPYDVVILNYDDTEPSMAGAAFRSINPMGKVPAIVHNGQVVTECAAICAYLADAFPEAGLAPAPADRGAYYRWLFFAAGCVEAAVTTRTLQLEIPAERQRMVGFGSYERTLDVLEGAVSAGPFVAGDAFTAADVYVGAQVIFGTSFGTIEPRPAFTAYADRLKARPAYLKATAIDDADAAARAASGAAARA